MPCPVPAKRHRDPNLPTIWEVPDALWDRIAPIIADLDPPKSTGRPRINARRALDASILRLRSGCQWNHLPNDLPDDSSVHRTLQRWITLGVLDRICASLIAECDELAAWTGSGNRPMRQWARRGWGDLIGPNPTDRGKRGVKRSLLVEAAGGPLGW